MCAQGRGTKFKAFVCMVQGIECGSFVNAKMALICTNLEGAYGPREQR